jgi:S-adenosyl-L-methionine hydrolase (adenosine-forming)
VSRTFEGRDRFAPAAAWLAKGTQLTALGRPAPDYQRLDIPAPAVSETSITGVVLRTDRFGNVVTNIDRRTFESVAKSGTMEVTAGDRSIGRLVATYADIQPGEICALFGSTDHLELAANSESAADRLQLARGGVVAVNRR